MLVRQKLDKLSIESIYPSGRPFFENMYTPTKAYQRKFSSGLVLTILALSAIATVFAVAPAISTANAANAQFTATMGYPYSRLGTSDVRVIKLTNPLGNLGISEIDINIPAGAAQAVSGATPQGLANSGGCTVSGTGPWTIVCNSPTAGATILPAGAAVKILPAFTAEASESASGTADAYSFTVTVHYSDGSTQNAVIRFFEGALSATDVTTTATDVVAGSSYTYALAIAADLGIPLKWFSNPDVAAVAGDGFSASFGTPSFTTTSATTYVSSFTTTEASSTSCAYGDNGALDTGVPCGYFAWVDVGIPSSSDTGGLLTLDFQGNAVPTTAGVVAGAVEVDPSGPTQVSIGTCYDSAGYSPTVVSDSVPCALSITLADKFGNAVTPVGLAGTATLAAAAGSLYCGDGTHTCGSSDQEGVTVAGFDSVVDYAPQKPSNAAPLAYSSFDLVTASLTVTAPTAIAGTYAGASKSLEIGYLQGLVTPEDTIYKAPYQGAGNVRAGSTVNLAAAFAAPATGGPFPAYVGEQSGVPVNMSLATDSASAGPYTGTFSNGLAWIIVKTNSNGIATANFTSDTIAGDEADASLVVSDPTTALPSNTASAITPPDSPFLTGVATPGSLKIQTYLYSGSGSCTTTTSSTYVAPGSYECIRIKLADAYGNSVTWTGAFALQITLSTSAGGLSATTVYITAPNGDTWTSGYQVEFTAPSSLGTVTLSASTPQSGIASSTATIHVVSLNPSVTLTPTATTSLNSNSATVNATGIPSLAEPLGVVVVSFAYSLNGAANVTAPLTGTNSSGAGFTSFPVTFNNGSNTIKIFGTDSNGNTGVGTFTFTVSHPPPGQIFSSPGASAATSNGFTGVNATFTNTGSSETVNVFFVWYNSNNQVVSVGAQLNVAFASGGTASFFNTYQSSGSYTVKVFVQDTAGNALSTSYSASVTIS